MAGTVSQSVYREEDGSYVGEIDADVIVVFTPRRLDVRGSRADIGTLYYVGPHAPDAAQRGQSSYTDPHWPYPPTEEAKSSRQAVRVFVEGQPDWHNLNAQWPVFTYSHTTCFGGVAYDGRQWVLRLGDWDRIIPLHAGREATAEELAAEISTFATWGLVDEGRFTLREDWE